ncbi:MAG TPA: phosphatidylserine/phosphatidylglycerophosphate/cardiolipin synthase family protein [Stenomitos sp.]
MAEIRRSDEARLAYQPPKKPTTELKPSEPAQARAAGDTSQARTATVVTEQRKAELVTQANKAVVTSALATQEYAIAKYAGDEPAAEKAHDLATSTLTRYQETVRELNVLGVDYVPPHLPTPSDDELAKKAQLRFFDRRLQEAKGSTLKTIGAELHNDFDALKFGLSKGFGHLWDRFVHFLHHPLGDAKQMFVDAASLLMHPIRNTAHALQAANRLLDKNHYEQLMNVGEVLPNVLTAPTVVPLVAELKEGVRRSESRAEQARLQQIAVDGVDAPAGRSPIGTAVNRAVWGTHEGPLDPAQAITSGVVDDVWVNQPDGDDAAMHKVCELIKNEAQHEVSFQTYIFDPDSPAAKELLETLAAKQRANPDFRINVVVDKADIVEAFEKYGIKAQVSVARPTISRRGQHTKMYVVDGKIGVIGGDNVDNPKEKDLLIKVRGEVVQRMLGDFDDAWKRSAKHFNGDATPPAHEPDTSPPPEHAVPMTMLGKRGVLGFYSEDYTDNDADQGLLAAMHAAQHELKIASPNLNADAVLKEIKEAAERGVKVKLMVPMDYQLFGSAVDAANNKALLSFMAELPEDVRANIELRNFSTNGKDGEQAHTKFVAVDAQWAYVGSQNSDNQSYSFSRELGVGIDDADQVKRIAAEAFDKDWETSIPMQPGWWANAIPHALFDH